MRKFEMYPDYHYLFEYHGNNEIERVRIKSGRAVRRDWFVFETRHDAVVFFSQRCGVFTGYYG